ncbi:MAG: hypothetical protein FJ087_09590 [Deltaproteobacteria bacterium]|nr:hypothetical protein [Deltaproteobacteria bacterium]
MIRTPTAIPHRVTPVFIRHRVNRIADVAALRPGWGAEVDLRSDPCLPGSLLLSHDPWTRGDDFEAWLAAFATGPARGTLVLNTKEDGLESRVLSLLAASGVSDFFFLDTALPTLVRFLDSAPPTPVRLPDSARPTPIRRPIAEGETRFAVRVSAHEPPSASATFRGRARWAWADCFGGEPLPPGVVEEVARDFSVCLVSPELQGRPIADLRRFAGLWPHSSAVCTKDPDAWIAAFGSASAD